MGLTLFRLHVVSAVVIVPDIHSRLLLTAVCGVITRKANFVSTVLAVNESAEIGNISTAVTLVLRHRLLHFTYSVPKLLSNNRLMRILHNNHIVLIVFDNFMILVADRCCAELKKMSEIGVSICLTDSGLHRCRVLRGLGLPSFA